MKKFLDLLSLAFHVAATFCMAHTIGFYLFGVNQLVYALNELWIRSLDVLSLILDGSIFFGFALLMIGLKIPMNPRVRLKNTPIYRLFIFLSRRSLKGDELIDHESTEDLNVN